MSRAKMVANGVLKLLLVFCVVDWSAGYSKCTQMLRKEKIVPKFANRIESTDLKVNYMGKDYKCGDSILLQNNLFAPTVTFDVKRQCKYVTVAEFLLVDPDITSLGPDILWLVYNIPAADHAKGFNENSDKVISQYAPVKDATVINGLIISDPYDTSTGPYLLWLVYNIPAADLAKGFNGNSGKVISQHISMKNATEINGFSGNKYVVFFVYCQDDCICKENTLLRTERFRYDLKDNAKEKQLGDPVAASIHKIRVLKHD